MASNIADAIPDSIESYRETPSVAVPHMTMFDIENRMALQTQWDIQDHPET